jgi:hypothetical protein
MPIRHERYQPAIPLDQLTKQEQESIAQELGLTWNEVMAAVSYPTQQLVDLLTAQARIVQAIEVAQRKRDLNRIDAELTDMYEHRRGISEDPG